MKKATTAEDFTIKQLREALRFSVNNKFSDFYRKKYKKRPLNYEKINSYEDFQKVPFLEREEIVNTPLFDRIFMPVEELTCFGLSSGTTSESLPLTVPIKFPPLTCADYREKLFKELGIKRIMMIFPPVTLFTKIVRQGPRFNGKYVPGDINNFDLSAKMIELLDVQGIEMTPTILNFFLPYLKKYNVIGRIKLVELSAEYCSKQQADYFRRQFPKALIDFKFGSVESGLRGYRCENMADMSPNNYHAHKDALLYEIINPDTGEVVSEGEDGEIIITHIIKSAFPVIRYKTGDQGALRKNKCACGNEYFLEMKGRINSDYVKFSGVTLTTQNIANALEKVSAQIESGFQMHLSEKEVEGKIIPELTIQVTPRNKKEAEENALMLENLTDSVSRNLKMSPKNTLHDLVEKNVILPLRIEFVAGWPELLEGKKVRPIILHDSF